MIRLNLLPHRAHKQARNKQRFHLLLAAALAGSAVILFVVGITIEEQTDQQRQLTQLLQAEHNKLDQKIRQGKELQEKISVLDRQQHHLESLQQHRNDAVQLLADLAQRMPPRIALRTLAQDGAHLSLSGHAPSHQDIVKLLDELHDASGTFRQAELREARAAANPGNPALASQGHDFVITASHFPATRTGSAATPDKAEQ